MTDAPISPRAFLADLLGPELASRLRPRPTVVSVPSRGAKALRDAMLESERKARRQDAFRRYAVASILIGLGVWTALTPAFNQAVLASLGPAGVLGVVALWLSLHRAVRRP